MLPGMSGSGGGSGERAGAAGRAAGPTARVRVGRGPREVEALLFAEVERRLAAGARDPAALARPLRIVVPSNSLAQHLSAQLVRCAGRSVLGVSVRTIHAVASELVARAGIALPDADGLFEVAVRRAARAEPDLAGLDDFIDGHAAVGASVRDLLDAGFAPVHADALEEAIESAAPGAATSARARAVVRVARRLAGEVESGQIGHRSRLLAAAREVIERDGEAALPSRGILIHGFADATGVVTDLLCALVERCGALALIDRPPDPADPGRDDPGARFGHRFAERIADGPLPAAEPPVRSGAAEVEVVHAPGRQAEAREIADALRRALDAGAVPEQLAVVARDPGAHRLALRVHFGRLAIPFSGLGESGPPTPAGRRLADLLALLRDGTRVRAERWLEALELDRGGQPLTPAERADLRSAFHALGATRLREVAELGARRPLAPGDVALPLRTGLARSADGLARVARRRLPRAHLDAAVAASRVLAGELAAFEAGTARPLAEWCARVHAVARGALGWGPGDPALRELDEALSVGELGPAETALDADEFRLLLERRLEGAGVARLGGRGGGVAMLSVTEARARTFDALWLAGLERDVFPRSVTEDPLLPDALRDVLRPLLPDLPLKRDGHDEERFLFAQLVASSPRVALLAAVCDDEGDAREPSPLVERLRLAPGVAGPRAANSPAAAASLGAGALRPAHELAVLAGAHGSSAQLEALLPAAIAEAWSSEASKSAPEVAPLAAGRLAVLRELDRAAYPGVPLGPYFGFVGPLGPELDPRRGAVYATTLEAFVRCPWQAFLTRVLRLEAPPDPGGELPAADPLRVGSLVHAVLHRIVSDALGAEAPTLAEAAAREPVAVDWPAEASLARIALDAARALLEQEGVSLKGFERVLAFAARPLLDQARSLAWAASGVAPGVVGAEVEGALGIEGPGGESFELRFRADRVERDREVLSLLDYKTGRPKISVVSDAKRREKLLAAVAAGELLQGAAYAAGAGALGLRGRGRYLHLRPDLRDETREIACESGDGEIVAAFASAVRTALAAWSAGAFFPRLATADGSREPDACRSCGVREGCLRGDSAARGRLVHFALAGDGRARGVAESALVALWRIGEGDAASGSGTEEAR
jgi:hypothetical protein